MENPVCAMWAEHYKNMSDWVNWQMDDLTDEEMKQSPGPGLNHGVWILGHLIVSDDDLAMYLGKGELLFPDLVAKFGSPAPCLEPDKYPSATELKLQWKQVYERNITMIAGMSDWELDDLHALNKDPAKDFFKTKKGILSHWILHQQYHAGQLGMLNAKVMRQRPPKPETK